DLMLSRPSTVQDADSHPSHAALLHRDGQKTSARRSIVRRKVFSSAHGGESDVLYLFYLTATARLRYMPLHFTTHGSLSYVPSKTRSRLRVVLRSPTASVYSVCPRFSSRHRCVGTAVPWSVGGCGVPPQDVENEA